MATKNGSEFRNDYPNGTVKHGDAYDGQGNKVGYQTGDGDIRTKDGTLYKNNK